MPGFMVFDVESVPDGDFISRTKYPGERLSPDKAIQRAEHEAKSDSNGRSDFVALTYHVPVACGVARLDENYFINRLSVHDGTPEQITAAFWSEFDKAAQKGMFALVSFNGRTFDLPLLELMAYKYGLQVPQGYWGKYGPRNRFGDGHIDLMDWFGNFGASKVVGGLDALAKLIGRTGKSIHAGLKKDGRAVLKLHAEGKQAEINDYCACDVLDTYAVFVRTRLMMGQITKEQEDALLVRAAEVTLQ